MTDELATLFSCAHNFHSPTHFLVLYIGHHKASFFALIAASSRASLVCPAPLRTTVRQLAQDFTKTQSDLFLAQQQHCASAAEQNQLLEKLWGKLHAVNEQLTEARPSASDGDEAAGHMLHYVSSLEVRLQSALFELHSRESAHIHSVAEMELLRAELEICNKVCLCFLNKRMPFVFNMYNTIFRC